MDHWKPSIDIQILAYNYHRQHNNIKCKLAYYYNLHELPLTRTVNLNMNYLSLLADPVFARNAKHFCSNHRNPQNCHDLCYCLNLTMLPTKLSLFLNPCSAQKFYCHCNLPHCFAAGAVLSTALSTKSCPLWVCQTFSQGFPLHRADDLQQFLFLHLCPLKFFLPACFI